MSAPDPFALGGRQDGDERVLALFRQWIELMCEYGVAFGTSDPPPEEKITTRLDEVEDEIIAAPGGVALAVKTFLFLHHDCRWAPGAYLRVDLDEKGYGAVELLRTAGGIVPEIAELSAPIIHDDAELIDADMEVGWARMVLAEAEAEARPQHPLRYHEKWLRETKAKLAAALDRIAEIEAKTERGAEIKRRYGLLAEPPDATCAVYREEGAS